LNKKYFKINPNLIVPNKQKLTHTQIAQTTFDDDVNKHTTHT